ncbi:MAG: type II toxin-antitoxin system prevent-host-death family antitoxin [Chloroflexota bacterium]|nr:type II toxin-antitoxin system prevent-host-death family antitoxin [Chloroflexota bacterium]
MLKSISSSELRAQIKRVLSEVGYGEAQYVVRRFGEPAAAIVSMEDLRLLQAAKRKEAMASLRERISEIRRRAGDVDTKDVDHLIEEARAEFYALRQQEADES